MTPPAIRNEPNRAAQRVRRTNTACVECRERKVRCSGNQPCNNCVRRGSECFFEQEKKVVVSERYLNDLKRKAEGDHQGARSPHTQPRIISPDNPDDADKYLPLGLFSPSTKDVNFCKHLVASTRENRHGTDRANDSTEISNEALQQLRNPLVTNSPSFLTDHQGKRRFLGPSSTWAYSRHAMSMIQEHLGEHSSPHVPLNVDATAFPLDIASMKDKFDPAIMDDIPSFDYAIYLTNTVKFHVTQTYHLFEEANFTQTLNYIYSEEASSVDPERRLDYIQYFIVMALGKALMGRVSSKTQPPGGEYLMRAMELFPDITGLYRDPILAVEICCGLALYLQSIDHRNSAYIYLGLALRLSLSQGLHRDLSGSYRDAIEGLRHRNAWWTLYILDRKFPALMGTPSSINDNDISVPLPEGRSSTQTSKIIDMHVKLSRLIAKVISTVYATDERLDSSFLRNTQVILRELAKLGDELNTSLNLKYASPTPLSRVSATLNLCYHQCILLATRPLLICLLRDRLQNKSNDNPSYRHTIEPITALLKTSGDSASQSLRILAALQSHDLLETFLPFDLEQIFSSGFIITLLSAVHPHPNIIEEVGFEKSLDLLDTLIANGNAPARFRREELTRLREMLRLATQEDMDAEEPEEAPLDLPDVAIRGMTPDQILSIADLIESYPDLDTLLGADNDNWLWEAEAAMPNHPQPSEVEDYDGDMGNDFNGGQN